MNWWDVHTKLLVKECAQDFVTYFLPGAQFIGFREGQLQTRGDGPFKPREIRTDLLFEAEILLGLQSEEKELEALLKDKEDFFLEGEKQGKHFLLIVEWQTTLDKKMDARLMHYSCEATNLHNLDVFPAVFYPRKVGVVPQSPLERALGEQKLLWFWFASRELAEIPVDEFRQYNLDGLTVLMPFCKDGTTYEVLDEVLERLKNRKELLSLVRFFAGKVFTSEEDQKRLDRRFAMLHDFLQDSWTVQQTLEEGRIEGRIDELRQSIEAVVQIRCPELFKLVQSKIRSSSDLKELREIALKMNLLQTDRDLRTYMLSLE